LLRARLGEIEKEATRLRGALSSLDGGEPANARRPRRRTTARRSSSKRAVRGQRPKQFLAAVEANPKATVAEIAREIGVSPNQAGSLARRLEAKGQIKRSKQGFRIAAGAK
jgi:anti-sigma factor RsiW